ncbi:MAG: hypothetical protein JST10_13700 [Bacteroidetes bacterium]|nr:hypothetical protein [Bacteroidota bacterium]
MRFTLLILMTLMSSLAFAQKNYSLARANKINGKLIFYENEPVEPYDVSFTFQNDIGKENDLTQEKIMQKSMVNAGNESANQGRSFDAIIVQHTTKRDIAVIFKDKSRDNSIARVKKHDGILVFIQCEPINNYEVVEKFSHTDQIDFGRIGRLINRGHKRNLEFNGLIYSTSTHELLIRFAQ